MKWIVKNNDGVLEFNSTVVCTESEYNKINAGINQQKIKAWCDDNHVSVETIKGEQCISVIKEIVTEVDEREARRMDRLHENFLRFVSHLPEVDAAERCDVDEQLEENIKFVKEVLDEWDETETRLGTCGAILLGKDSECNFTVPCGRISSHLLKQMFQVWLDKYGK